MPAGQVNRCRYSTVFAAYAESAGRFLFASGVDVVGTDCWRQRLSLLDAAIWELPCGFVVCGGYCVCLGTPAIQDQSGGTSGF